MTCNHDKAKKRTNESLTPWQTFSKVCPKCNVLIKVQLTPDRYQEYLNNGWTEDETPSEPAF